MNQIFRNLLIQYQNYLLEFYQLIEDKEVITEKQQAIADNIKKYLENIPEFDTNFEIAYSLTKRTGGLSVTWSANITDEGFSIRSFSLDDMQEADEWYFHYHDSTQEYEGNLFTDGDWDLFLEEIAEVDDANGEVITCELFYSVGESV